jgi:AcrR family transcriptional regulator
MSCQPLNLEEMTVPAALRTTRAGWIDAGLSALASGGPAAVRVEPIAAQLGVTKGGFYRHFADRTAFLSALLHEWERRSVDEVIDRVEADEADAATNVRRAGTLTFAKDLLPIDLAMRDWARSDSNVAMRLRRVDNARIGYLRSQFAKITGDRGEVEARSLLAFALVIGQHFITAEHEKFSRTEALNLAVAFLTAPPREQPHTSSTSQ